MMYVFLCVLFFTFSLSLFLFFFLPVSLPISLCRYILQRTNAKLNLHFTSLDSCHACFSWMFFNKKIYYSNLFLCLSSFQFY